NGASASASSQNATAAQSASAPRSCAPVSTSSTQYPSTSDGSHRCGTPSTRRSPTSWRGPSSSSDRSRRGRDRGGQPEGIGGPVIDPDPLNADRRTGRDPAGSDRGDCASQPVFPLGESSRSAIVTNPLT